MFSTKRDVTIERMMMMMMMMMMMTIV